MMTYNKKNIVSRLVGILKKYFLSISILTIPTVGFANSADYCPNEFEIVDFGIYESGVIGEGPRTFGGILLKIGKRIKPKMMPVTLGVLCAPKGHSGSKKQYFQGYEVPLVSRVYLGGGGFMSFWGSGERAYEFAELRSKGLYEVWTSEERLKEKNEQLLLGKNFVCIYDQANTAQKVDGGYGCLATIDGMDFPNTQFSCGFGCSAGFSLKNGLKFRLELGGSPEFLKDVETIREAEKAWEAFLLKFKDDIYSQIIERDSRVSVVEE
jgi:hypothetical protein